MNNSFWEAVAKRRTIYALGNEQLVNEKRLEEILKDTLLHTPSAFNSQSTRVVLLLGTEHTKLWNIVLAKLKERVSDKQFEQTEKKINTCFAAGYGTVLFFEDCSVVEGLQKSFPSYSEMFPIWSQHANAMHQFVVWTGLENEGLGVSLQHYNPLIDEAVAKEWKIPQNWQLVAQMPFGSPLVDAEPKEFKALEERLLVFNN
ncbi:MAG TPA: nitroreductase family protein [Candidatus Avacidaminococcus intestinavium]|uniref:Nitroreductase family protein n=1 Tax=Candidatus Avacidaminococcus intestinavium TaxID=2840684 RepID=A0A9D1MQF9_9FIRM|nr:nitroreductase family protein [Candidatus Avacidaminococcus intestinavium]